MSFLTGKTKPATSTSTSLSENKAYPWLQETYSPQVQTGIGASNQLAALLGLGGDPTAANAAYNQFRNASGYQNIFNEAMRGVTNSAAGRGLFGSGATGRALQTTAGNLANQSFGNYLQYLTGLSNIGLQSGNLIGGAGQTSTSETQSTGQTTKGGLFDAIGGALDIAGAAKGLGLFALSERSLKRDIRKVDELEDGLGVYDFKYIWGDEVHRGVMADEVEKLRPWALGPEISGYRTVNYGAL